MPAESTDAPLPKRRRLRLRGFDYAQPGMYFVTICSNERRQIFGSILEARMSPSMIGEAVLDEWFALPGRFSHVDLDAFVLMPNHLHGLVLLRAEGPSLSAVIAAFKNLATRSAREKCRATIGSLWQRGFYDHIVRNERDLERIREYIETNPARWAYDGNNPVNWPRGT